MLGICKHWNDISGYLLETTKPQSPLWMLIQGTNSTLELSL